MSYTKEQPDNLDALLKCWQKATGKDEIATLKEICLWMSESLNEEIICLWMSEVLNEELERNASRGQENEF